MSVSEQARLKSLLSSGPVDFSTYMQAALYHPDYGYYASGISYTDDFITAPSHSQYLAIVIAKWLVSQGVLSVAEFGPGQGHLASDVTQNLKMFSHQLKTYLLVEPSKALREHQSAQLSIHLFESVKSLPAAFGGAVVANEVLDALPARRFKWQKGHLYEWYLVPCRVEGFAEQWRSVQDALILACIQDYTHAWPDSYIFEVVNYEHLVQTIALTSATDILFIDYGYPGQTYFSPQFAGSRLKVISKHQHVAFDPLDIGEVDLSVGVNWTQVINAAQGSGFSVEKFGPLFEFMFAYQVHEHVNHDDQSAIFRFKELMLPGGIAETMQVLWLKRN